jgi:glutaredoxin 3
LHLEFSTSTAVSITMMALLGRQIGVAAVATAFIALAAFGSAASWLKSFVKSTVSAQRS